MGKCVLRCEECTGEINVQHAPPTFFISLMHGLAYRNTGAVYERVKPAKQVDDTAHLDRARKDYVWLHVGTGRLNEDGTFDSMLDRMPIGGFSGHIHFLPIGMKPPEPAPQRPGPGEPDDDDV